MRNSLNIARGIAEAWGNAPQELVRVGKSGVLRGLFDEGAERGIAKRVVGRGLGSGWRGAHQDEAEKQDAGEDTGGRHAETAHRTGNAARQQHEPGDRNEKEQEEQFHQRNSECTRRECGGSWLRKGVRGAESLDLGPDVPPTGVVPTDVGIHCSERRVVLLHPVCHGKTGAVSIQPSA